MESPRLLYNNAKIIWFEFRIILHECFSIMLQVVQIEQIVCTETIICFFSLFTGKKYIFLPKCRP